MKATSLPKPSLSVATAVLYTCHNSAHVPDWFIVLYMSLSQVLAQGTHSLVSQARSRESRAWSASLSACPAPRGSTVRQQVWSPPAAHVVRVRSYPFRVNTPSRPSACICLHRSYSVWLPCVFQGTSALPVRGSALALHVQSVITARREALLLWSVNRAHIRTWTNKLHANPVKKVRGRFKCRAYIKWLTV